MRKGIWGNPTLEGINFFYTLFNLFKTVSMKECMFCISNFFQTFIKIKRYIVEEICQEVLTLHLLTITLRRNLNPPGFFCLNENRFNGFHSESKTIDLVTNNFYKRILLINLFLLRLFNNCINRRDCEKPITIVAEATAWGRGVSAI